MNIFDGYDSQNDDFSQRRRYDKVWALGVPIGSKIFKNLWCSLSLSLSFSLSFFLSLSLSHPLSLARIESIMRCEGRKVLMKICDMKENEIRLHHALPFSPLLPSPSPSPPISLSLTHFFSVFEMVC